MSYPVSRSVYCEIEKIYLRKLTSKMNKKEEIISLETGGGIVVDLQISVTSIIATFGQ